MSSISGLGSSAWSIVSQQNQRPQQKLSTQLQEDFDADGSGGIDTSELQSLMDDVAKRTGQSSSTSAKDMLAASDANGDGSLSAEELEAALPSRMPQPSTMDFAQARGGDAPDDLFSKVDSDGSGSVNTAELTSMLKQMSGDDSISDEDAQALFSALDSDGDGALTQSEFDAARPQAPGGMPPPAQASGGAAAASSTSASGEAAPAGGAGGAGGAAGAGGASSSTTVYDELDTNEDGEVSAQERLAGALKDAEEAKAAAGKDQASSTASASASDDTTLRQRARDAMIQTVNRAYQAASGAAAPATSTISYAV